jgi:hypothetical protein
MFFFFEKKIAIYSSLGLHRGVQATGEAFSPQNITSTTSKLEIYYFDNCFLFFWPIFALLDPDPDCE